MNKYIVTVVINGIVFTSPVLGFHEAEDTLRRIANDNPAYNVRISVAAE